jgi:phosphoadenosine phosphosulfate reductase
LITGLRAEQSENRNDLLEYDEKFEIIKFNLLKWTLKEVGDYLENNVPQKTLHKKGFVVWLCALNRALLRRRYRAGRWWWESSHKECGCTKKIKRIEIITVENF